MRLSKLAIIFCVSAVLLSLSWWWWTPFPEKPSQRSSRATSRPSTAFVASSPPLNLGESRPRNQEERRKKTVAKVAAMLATPITFYGKVVDQNGEPIPGANVDYGTIDKFDESGSDYQSKSDENGGFSITGINGAVLTVGVRKAGYYNIHGKSDAAFAYGVGVDPTRKAPPTKDNPAMFVLQRIGVTESLLHIASRQYRMSKSGEPIEIDLKT